MIRASLFGNMNISWVKELEGDVAYYSLNIFMGLVYIGFYLFIFTRQIVWKNNNAVELELFWSIYPLIVLYETGIEGSLIEVFLDIDRNYEEVIKVIGQQWYWSYERLKGLYNEMFDMYNELEGIRLISGEKRLVLGLNIRHKILITSRDIIHSWSIPGLGVKVDAISGRINEIWLESVKEGLYTLHCQELCGQMHYSMNGILEFRRY